LGADQVIDYTREDFTKNGETYDLIFDILGKSSFSKCKNSLKQNGIYLLASFKMKQLFQMLWTSLTGGKKVICALSSENAEDLKFIKRLVEEGKLRSLIDKCYPLDEAAEAHRYVETGSRTGSVIITVA
jgi:NADPH:quinone reductase-like Zn-dependent oxidoreductase